MKIKLVKDCHIQWIAHTKGETVEVDDAVAISLVEGGYAKASKSTEIETAATS
jgi:hypothetical protein